MSQSTSQKPIQRIFIILSTLAFVGSTVFGFVSLFSGAFQQPQQDAKIAEVKSRETQLQAQERGYESVLQREPENQIALQGLVQIRLQKNDLPGAVEPMEKLVKLNPEKAEYKALLSGIKERMGKGGKVGDR